MKTARRKVRASSALSIFMWHLLLGVEDAADLVEALRIPFACGLWQVAVQCEEEAECVSRGEGAVVAVVRFERVHAGGEPIAEGANVLGESDAAVAGILRVSHAAPPPFCHDGSCMSA